MKLLFYFLVLNFISAACQAMPIPDLVHYDTPALSLTELIDIALKNNPETKTAWSNAQRAAAARMLATVDYAPKVRFHADVVHSRDYKFPNGQETTYTLIDADVILSYLLYDFGETNAKNEAAKAALVAANWQSDWTMQKVIYNVVSQTYVYLNALEQLNSRLASWRDAKTTLEAAEEMYKTGLRTVTDVYSIKATVSDMEMGIAQQRAETAIALGRLAANLGLEVDEELNVMGLPDPNPNAVENRQLECLLDEAFQKRADLLAKRSDLQQKYALKDKVIAQYKPKLNINGSGGYKRFIHDRSNGAYYKIALNFDMPLYDNFEGIYQKRVAFYDTQATESELDRLELEIAMEILTYSKMFESAQQVLVLARESLQNSFKTFSGTLDKYKAGTQSIFDLTAAQKQLADARLKHSDAKTRWYKSLAQLAYATGTITQFTEEACAIAE